MTTAEVEERAGKPAQRQTSETERRFMQYWYYDFPGVRTQIAFEDGKVRSINTN